MSNKAQNVTALTSILSDEEKFIARVVEAQTLLAELNNLKDHEEVIKYAAKKGYHLTPSGLDIAMKDFAMRTQEADGIPEWIRKRVRMAVHD